MSTQCKETEPVNSLCNNVRPEQCPEDCGCCKVPSSIKENVGGLLRNKKKLVNNKIENDPLKSIDNGKEDEMQLKRLSISLSDIKTQMDSNGIHTSKTLGLTETLETSTKIDKQKKNKLSLKANKKLTTHKKNGEVHTSSALNYENGEESAQLKKCSVMLHDIGCQLSSNSVNIKDIDSSFLPTAHERLNSVDSLLSVRKEHADDERNEKKTPTKDSKSIESDDTGSFKSFGFDSDDESSSSVDEVVAKQENQILSIIRLLSDDSENDSSKEKKEEKKSPQKKMKSSSTKEKISDKLPVLCSDDESDQETLQNIKKQKEEQRRSPRKSIISTSAKEKKSNDLPVLSSSNESEEERLQKIKMQREDQRKSPRKGKASASTKQRKSSDLPIMSSDSEENQESQLRNLKEKTKEKLPQKSKVSTAAAEKTTHDLSVLSSDEENLLTSEKQKDGQRKSPRKGKISESTKEKNAFELPVFSSDSEDNQKNPRNEKEKETLEKSSQKSKVSTATTEKTTHHLPVLSSDDECDQENLLTVKKRKEEQKKSICTSDEDDLEKNHPKKKKKKEDRNSFPKQDSFIEEENKLSKIVNNHDTEEEVLSKKQKRKKAMACSSSEEASNLEEEKKSSKTVNNHIEQKLLSRKQKKKKIMNSSSGEETSNLEEEMKTSETANNHNKEEVLLRKQKRKKAMTTSSSEEASNLENIKSLSSEAVSFNSWKDKKLKKCSVVLDDIGSHLCPDSNNLNNIVKSLLNNNSEGLSYSNESSLRENKIITDNNKKKNKKYDRKENTLSRRRKTTSKLNSSSSEEDSNLIKIKSSSLEDINYEVEKDIVLKKCSVLLEDIGGTLCSYIIKNNSRRLNTNDTEDKSNSDESSLNVKLKKKQTSKKKEHSSGDESFGRSEDSNKSSDESKDFATEKKEKSRKSKADKKAKFNESPKKKTVKKSRISSTSDDDDDVDQDKENEKKKPDQKTKKRQAKQNSLQIQESSRSQRKQLRERTEVKHYGSSDSEEDDNVRKQTFGKKEHSSGDESFGRSEDSNKSSEESKDFVSEEKEKSRKSKADKKGKFNESPKKKTVRKSRISSTSDDDDNQDKENEKKKPDKKTKTRQVKQNSLQIQETPRSKRKQLRGQPGVKYYGSSDSGDDDTLRKQTSKKHSSGDESFGRSDDLNKSSEESKDFVIEEKEKSRKSKADKKGKFNESPKKKTVRKSRISSTSDDDEDVDQDKENEKKKLDQKTKKRQVKQNSLQIQETPRSQRKQLRGRTEVKYYGTSDSEDDDTSRKQTSKKHSSGDESFGKSEDSNKSSEESKDFVSEEEEKSGKSKVDKKVNINESPKKKTVRKSRISSTSDDDDDVDQEKEDEKKKPDQKTKKRQVKQNSLQIQETPRSQRKQLRGRTEVKYYGSSDSGDDDTSRKKTSKKKGHSSSDKSSERSENSNKSSEESEGFENEEKGLSRKSKANKSAKCNESPKKKAVRKSRVSSTSDDDDDEKENSRLRKRTQVQYFQSDDSEEDESDEKSSSKNDTSDSDFDIKDLRPSYSRKREHTVKESLSEYEKQLQEKRAEKFQLLESLGIVTAKNDLFGSLKSMKQRKKRIKEKNSNDTPVQKRVSEREKKSVNYAEEYLEELNKKLESKVITFKEVLKNNRVYEDFLEDFKEIVEPGDCVKPSPLLYNKEILKQPLKISLDCHYPQWSAMTWHPSVENLVLVTGNAHGKLDFWNIMESDYAHYTFPVHSSNKISHLQFNPCNTFQLISSSFDGKLFCCDMEKQVFNEVLSTSDIGCTYFDFFSPTSYLVSLENGEIILNDHRTSRGRMHTQVKRHKCHDYTIRTVNVHPVNKSYFVTAGWESGPLKRWTIGCRRTVEIGKICIWDLRKLSRFPVIEYSDNQQNISCAFFSPVAGNFLLTKSLDSLSMFDCTNLTEESMQWYKTVKYKNTDINNIVRPVWMPNSDETFACYFQNLSLQGDLNVFDKDFNIYEKIQDGARVKYYKQSYVFHPFRTALATAGTGKIFVST